MRANPKLSRREALKTVSAVLLISPTLLSAAETPAANRKMTINLMCGMIGVRADQRTAIELAHAHGFESVEAMPSDLARMSADEVKELVASMKSKNLVFGASGLPVEFRRDDAAFQDSMKSLP